MRRLWSLSWLLVAGSIVGCSVLRVELDAPIDRPTGGYHEGRTHYRNVLADLGPPANVSQYNDGVAFLYEHLAIRENQVGLSIDSEALGERYEFLEWLKFAYGAAYAEREALLLIFDGSGILQTERFVSWRDDLGTGLSLQLIIELTELVDISSLREDQDAAEWGRALLRTPPELLNARQSLELGQAGLELRGAPKGVGQHTLEMRED